MSFLSPTMSFENILESQPLCHSAPNRKHSVVRVLQYSYMKYHSSGWLHPPFFTPSLDREYHPLRCVQNGKSGVRVGGYGTRHLGSGNFQFCTWSSSDGKSCAVTLYSLASDTCSQLGHVARRVRKYTKGVGTAKPAIPLRVSHNPLVFKAWLKKSR